MTIIHISSTLGAGGAEKMVLNLAKQSNTSYPTKVISVTNIKNIDTKVETLEQEFSLYNIEVHHLNISSFKKPRLIHDLKNLNNIIKRSKNVVFHCHQYHSFVLIFLYNILYKKHPIVFTLHTNALELIGRRWFLFLTKNFRKTDIIFSKNSKKWYLKNSIVIPNGIDLKSYSSKPKVFNNDKKFEFLFLGRLHHPKNPLYLIEAANHLINKGIENFIINIVGDGNMREHLLSQISTNNLEDKFFFHGFQRDVTKYLYNSHCLILPSIREGMPMVILEAAATKTPILATPVGSIPDFLNNENAYVSKLDSFSQTMIDLYNDYPRALEKTETLFKKVNKEYDLKEVYNEHLNVYKKLEQL